MKRQSKLQQLWFIRGARITFLAALCSAAFADPITLNISGSLTASNLNGANVGAGTYTTRQLSGIGGAVGTISAGVYVGVPLWSLLGGNSAGTTSDVVTDSGKNSILRSFLVATNSVGSQFVISLGEVDPFFGGASTTAPFVAFAGGNGNPALIFPGAGATGRNVQDLASLQVLSLAAPPVGPGGLSANLLLSGNVSNPGLYGLADLKSLPAVSETISGDTYTGVPLWSFLGVNTGNEFNQYVLALGSDGYESLFSLAELDPALGAPLDLVPYADTAGQFPADGFARVVIPGDNHAGRYVSNLTLIEVTTIPEPGTLLSLGIGLVVLAFAALHRRPGIT